MKTFKSRSISECKSKELWFLVFLMFFISGCEKEPNEILNVKNASAKETQEAGPYHFSGAVFDISATPDGSIMVGVNSAEGRSIQQIKNGKIRTIQEVNVATNIQGVQAIGTGNAFFTTAGSDLAEDGELYRVSNGNVRMVADLGKFEQDNDPDAFEGVQWKNQECENYGTFSAGPQNNPFKLTAFDGETALIADAAGNTILRATTTGEIDWKAILTPPVQNGEYMVLFETGDLDCYVQPVPTSVAIGPDGYIYVGELIGEIADGLPIGMSRIWKFPADANNIVCSELEGSENCNVFVNGLTSVIDVEFGPDDLLYVVEYDENSWLAPFIFEEFSGTVSAYDLDGNLIKEATGLLLPSAITFDKKGNLWLLENNIFAPSIRILQPDEFEFSGS